MGRLTQILFQIRTADRFVGTLILFWLGYVNLRLLHLLHVKVINLHLVIVVINILLGPAHLLL